LRHPGDNGGAHLKLMRQARVAFARATRNPASTPAATSASP
jgi:hypothetical protein